MKKKQPTIRDIAEQAGVSAMTVSRALRGESNVDPNTAARVHAVADRLGYHRNLLVSTVMSTMRGSKQPLCNPIIAFLSASSATTHPEQRLASRLYFEGAHARAAECGFEVEEYVMKPTPADSEKLFGMLHARNIRGLLVGPLWRNFDDLALDWREFSSSAISINLVEPDLDRCGVDPVQSINLAFQNLTRLGYRRIGFGLSPFHVGMSHRRSRAMFLDYQCELPPDRTVPLIKDWSLRGLSDWLDQEKPDAIIGHGDEVLSWLSALDVNVPRDIGYVDIKMFEGATVPIAGVVFDYRSIGAAAVDMVINNLLRDSYGLPEHPVHSYIQGYWQDGFTVREQSPSPRENGAPPLAGLEAAPPAPAPDARWKPLDLSGVATHSYRAGKDISKWEDGLGLPLEPGRREINGAPFHFIDEKSNRGKGFILLSDQRRVTIPVGSPCAAVYFLLAAGFISSHGPLAEIVYTWADGQQEIQPLIAYFTPAPDPADRARWLAESSVQDWWPTFPRFTNPTAQAFRVGEDDQSPVEWRYLYTVRWTNPHREKPLRSITIRHLPARESKLAILAATLMEESK